MIQEERKELINEILSHCDSIINNSNRMTSGNFMHTKNANKFSAEQIKKCINILFNVKPRTRDDWQEIVKMMSTHFDCSLQQALDMYKEDRDKYIKWYNNNLKTLL